MSAQLQALIFRFLLGLILVEIPVLTGYLTIQPTPDSRILLAGLLGGLAGALEKYVAPTVVNLPAATAVSPVASALGASKVPPPPPNPASGDPPVGQSQTPA